jgi:hypothetical protein
MSANAVYPPSGSSGEIQFSNSSGHLDAARAFWDSEKSKLFISGSLETLGTHTVIDTTHLQIEDTVIGLGSGSAGEGAPSDRGLIFVITGETNPSFYWDESADEFRMARLTNVPSDSTFGNPSSISQSSGGYQGLRLGTISAVSGAIVDSENRAASNIGSDVYVYMSGSNDKRAVFGGDVVISGSLFGGSPLKIGSAMVVEGTAQFESLNIGTSEDGSYADGLFTDLTTASTVGTVVDRFNEILKALAPGPAPSLDDIDSNNSGVSGKLSFGSSNSVTNYTNSSTAAGFSAVDVDGTYSSTSSGNNIRIGLLNGSTVVSGDLNEDVSSDTHASSQTNYVANSFGDANSGTLKLYVNGSLIHSVVLTGSNITGHVGSGVPGSGTGSSINGSSSGFTNLSTTGSAVFSDGTTLDLFQHRTGRYSIAAADQRLGWNYARVIHTISSGDVETNYIEWINDNDSNALSAAGSVFDTLSMTGDRRLSGVKYHTAGSAQYRVRVLNAYKNVYTTSNITFTETNCSISNQSMPSAGDDEDKILHITGSATISANSLLNESISSSINVSHPIKSNLSSGGSQSISNILMWAYSNTSTTTAETFRRENYRVISGDYNSQSDVTNGSNAWDGTKHMSGSNTGHADGLMFYNQRLYSPSQGANSGNFSGISNGPAANVNYSGITSGTRTFYRYFQNTSGGSKTGFSLTIQGSGTIVPEGTSFSTSRIKVFLKLPTTTSAQGTGWMDLSTSFSTGQVSDNDGCLEGSLDDSLNATNTATFGTQFVADDEYIMLKIQADGSFTGYVSNITVSWS